MPLLIFFFSRVYIFKYPSMRLTLFSFWSVGNLGVEFVKSSCLLSTSKIINTTSNKTCTIHSEKEVVVSDLLMNYYYSSFQVKVLYVRNLTQYCSEEKLKEAFEQYGKVERVKRIKDYAFIHFEDRQEAITVREKKNG